LGKKPKPSKTPLGDRLAQTREKLGFSQQRAAFAETVGLTEPMLGYYERGDRTPDALALSAYRTTHGVSLTWLITGDGEMFDDPSKAPAPSAGVDIVLLQQLHDTVQSVFVECKQTPPPRAVTAEAGELYNQLLGMVADIRDKAVVSALLPVLRERFKERVANAEPGTGKREAS
jgi:transcriptional regulator with XRE-family HTH domain